MKTKAAPDIEAIESVLYLTKQKSLEGHCNHHAAPALPVVAAAPRSSYPAPRMPLRLPTTPGLVGPETAQELDEGGSLHGRKNALA
jgi:hypothetical protein